MLQSFFKYVLSGGRYDCFLNTYSRVGRLIFLSAFHFTRIFIQWKMLFRISTDDYFLLKGLLFAEIIIPLALPRNYTWQIPPHLLDKVAEGCRVEVVLGQQKKYAGIIKTLHHQKPVAFEPKYILNVLDTEPIVYKNEFSLWQWIAEYYMCTEGEVMAAALPSYFKLSSETILVFNGDYGDDFSHLDTEEYLVAEALHIKQEQTY